MARIRYFVLPAAWMAFIFTMSTSSFSSELTGSLLETIASLIVPGISAEALDVIHLVIRKLAHLTEYAVLALLLHVAFVRGAGFATGRAALAALVVSALYAATDEFHQSFVAGRTASVLDVAVDSSGAAIMLLVLRTIEKRRTYKGAP